MMPSKIAHLAMGTFLVFSGLSAYGMKFRDALKICQGQTSPECERVRAQYKKVLLDRVVACEGQQTPQCDKVRAIYGRYKNAVSTVPVVQRATSTPVKAAPVVQAQSAEKKEEPKWDERGEIKSPFSLGYFTAISGIGSKDDNGKSEFGAYAHLHWSYKTRWDWQAFARLPFNLDLSTGENEDSITALDPLIGIENITWKFGKWSLSNRLRLGLPLSQSSTDNGVTLSWGTDHNLSYSDDKFSFYIQLQPRGQFFGFGTEGDRNNGSAAFEIGFSPKLKGKHGLTINYASGFDRRVGRDLGFLVVTDDSQKLNAFYTYDFSKYITFVPGLTYNLDTEELGYTLWFWGSLF